MEITFWIRAGLELLASGVNPTLVVELIAHYDLCSQTLYIYGFLIFYVKAQDNTGYLNYCHFSCLSEFSKIDIQQVFPDRHVYCISSLMHIHCNSAVRNLMEM